MASPRRSSAPQVEYGGTSSAHHRHQVRLVESSSEDDDDEDEHKLQIDLSSAEEDSSSLESQDHNGVVPTTAGLSPPPSASETHSNPSDSDPLQSLQMLVRSPFAQGQISSAADASDAKGCESIPAASSSFSISSSQQQQSPATALSSNALQSTCAISLTPVLAAPANALSTASSSAATVAPLSTTNATDDGVCAEDENEEEEEEEEEDDDEEEGEAEADLGDDEDEGANRVSVATIQRVLRKLNSAAIDEINLRTLQQLPSDEAFSFNRFRKMLSNRSQFEALPNIAAAMVGTGGTFPPPRQQLTAFMRQEAQQPAGDSLLFSAARNPPALTVISTLDLPRALSRPSRRRSPPPMVPISSFRGCISNNNNSGEATGNSSMYGGFGCPSNQTVAPDGVFDMLKRLGTDVAVEPRSPPQFPLEDEDNDQFEYDDDDDELPFVPPECILSTEPLVTKVVSLPQLIPSEQASKSVTLSRIQPPPPPSLIPINCAKPSRFVPILPREPLPAWNIHVNQTPASTFTRPPSNLFPANQKFNFSGINSGSRKSKKQKLPNQSQFTKLANSLVLPANAPRRDPVLVAESVLAKAMKPQSSARLGELEIIKVGPSNDEPKLAFRPPTPPRLTFTATSTSFAQQPDVALFVQPIAPAPAAPQPTSMALAPPPNGPALVASATAKPNFFEFSLKKFANSTVLTKSQRKLYGCCVCSTVYHKMFSLKKHFYRTHVNPLCVSRQDALKYDVAIPQNSAEVGSAPLGESYRCDTCGLLFGDHQQLRLHLTKHQPSNYEHANRYRCSSCNFVFRKEKVFTRHLLECAATAGGATAISDAAEVCLSDEGASAEGSADVTAPPKAAAGELAAAQSVVPSDERATVDDEPVATSSSTVSAGAQSSNAGPADKTDELIVATGSANMMCLFCEVTFKDNTERQKHVLQNHHPKRKQQSCAYCKKKDINDLRELLQHICEVHNKKYFGCAKCKIRFKTKDELTAHRQESHAGNAAGAEKTAPPAVTKPKPATSVKTKNGRVFRCSKCLKLCKGMTELLSHRKTAHKPAKVKIKQPHGYDKFSDSLVTRAKHTPGSTDDIETEFYKKISLNVRTNLECYLDGRLDQKAPIESKCVTRSSQNNTLGGGCSDDSEIGAAPNGELGFVEMYGRENFNAAFLRNASRLHIGTQLTMLKKTNVLRQNGASEVQPLAGSVSVPSKLSLTPQKLSAVLVSEEGSQDVAANSTKDIEFSGEWIRPRRYICKVCLQRFNGFWEIEDHFWAKHPNVYHSFYEFPAEQDPGAEFLQTCKRSISNSGVCGKADIKWSTAAPSSECTKCGLSITPVAEFHKHILECGGDTTWMSTMYTPTKKHKKWRPYCGHRRRRTVTKNRMCVRNIPEMPLKLASQSKCKQKAGDTETIQKMIANLPPKRKTRRVVNFDDMGRSRFLNRTSVLTRRRREQLDPKSSARIAKAFAAENVDVMSIVRRNRKGSNSTVKGPLSVKNHELSQNSLSDSSDPAVQPIIKIEDTSEVVHATCSSFVDYKTNDEQLDDDVELKEIVGTENAGAPIDVDADEHSASESTVDIAAEKLRADAAPSTNAISVRTPIDASQIVRDVEVPEVEEPVDATLTNHSVTTSPTKVPESVHSSATVPRAISDEVGAEDFVDTAIFRSADQSPNKKLPTAEVTVASEEKPDAASSTLVSPDLSPSAAMADIKPSARASPVTDKVIEPSKQKTGSAQSRGRQSPALPDSSVILAAMADTFGQTDAVAPNAVYGGGKKRKRSSKQSKCKKCGSRSSRRQQLCAACSAQQRLQEKEAQLSSPPQKKQAAQSNFLQFVCECCGSEVFSTAREGKVCDMCLQKTACAKTEITDELPSEPLSSDRICGECGFAFSSDLTDILICDRCVLRKVCGTCGDKFDVTNDATTCSKCSLAAAAAAPTSPQAQAMVTTMSTLVRVTTPEKVTQTCRSCAEMYTDSSSDLCTYCQPKTPKQSYLAETSITPKSSSKPPFDSQETVATPKLKFETISPQELRTPSPTKLVEDNCCIHCQEQTNDRNDTGHPACRMCHELWITLNTDNLDTGLSSNGMEPECIECDVLRVNEATSQRYCEGCTAMKNSSFASGGAFSADNDPLLIRRRSSEVSVQVSESGCLPDSYSRVTKMPTQTSVAPGISSNFTIKSSDDPNKLSATGTKNTLLLICKGCYGTYNTVSAYKEHRQQCPFRNSDDEASKKPLLGFAKRIKSGVEIVQVDSPGAGSFEIDGGVLQVHDDSVGGGISNVVPKTEPSENISGQSMELDASTIAKRFKTKIATDESIAETINSVIERFCSTSTPILKSENIDGNSVAGPDISGIADCSSTSASVDKKVAKRLRSKVVDSPTRSRNMKEVEGEVETYLESSKSKKLTARKVFSFSDSSGDADAPHLKVESTTETSASYLNVDTGTNRRSLPSKSSEAFASEAATIVNAGSRGSSAKKRLRSNRTKSGGKTSARRKPKSSAATSNSAPVSATISPPALEEESASNSQDIAHTVEETPKSGVKKVLKKRRAEDDVLDQSSKVRLSSRLRRKYLFSDDVTASRVLRSNSKGDVTEESRDDVSVGSAKLEEDSTKTKKSDPAIVPKSEPVAKESTSSDRRRNPSTDKAKTKPAEPEVASAESVESASTSTEPDDKPSKSKSSKRKMDAKESTAGGVGSKRVRSSSQDLGFSVAKTGKNVRSNVRVKIEDENDETDDSNQLSTSLAVDGAVASTSAQEPQPGPAEPASATTSSNVSERGNFLELGPSVPQSYLQVSSIGERPASAEGLRARRTVAEEESMASQCRDLSNDLEQQHQLRFIESLSDSNFKDTTEMQRIQQNLDRSYSYVISMLNAVCEVLGSPEVSSNSLDPSVANELEELKRYADVASEAVLLLKNPKMEDADFSFNFSPVVYESKEPPKLYCELESQTKHYKDFFIRKATKPPIQSKDQISPAKVTTPPANGSKTTPAKNGKLKSNKNQSNGVKKKLRCNHCQKVLPTKNEMTAHIQDHFRRFTTSKKDNAEMLKKCIADGFEQLLQDKAIDSFLKHSNVSENGLCAPLKLLTESRDNQLEKWKSVVNKLVAIETEANSDLSNRMMSGANVSACRVEQNVENIEPSWNSVDCKPIFTFKRARNGELYQCPMCSTTYEQRKLRDRHLMMVHTRHRSSQKFIFDLDSAKSARANLIADSVMNASTSTPKNGAAASVCPVKCNGSLMAAGTDTPPTMATTPVWAAATGFSPCIAVATPEASAGKVEDPEPPPLTPPLLPKLEPASSPPPLLPADVEMPALSLNAAAGRESPPALTIASPLANSRPKTPPCLPAAVAAAPPPAAPAKATFAVSPPAKSNGVAASAAAAAPGTGATAPVQSTPARVMTNGRRYRRKMSKKEMNIPDDVIKAKAEEALRELTGNRFCRL